MSAQQLGRGADTSAHNGRRSRQPAVGRQQSAVGSHTAADAYDGGPSTEDGPPFVRDRTPASPYGSPASIAQLPYGGRGAGPTPGRGPYDLHTRRDAA